MHATHQSGSFYGSNPFAYNQGIWWHDILAYLQVATHFSVLNSLRIIFVKQIIALISFFLLKELLLLSWERRSILQLNTDSHYIFSIICTEQLISFL